MNKSTAAITYISTDLKLLAHKERLLAVEGISVTVKKTQESGYGGKKVIHVYASTAHKRVKEAVDVGVEPLLQDLTKEDIYLWYLDDGSWHISRNTMHLYSNGLNKAGSNVLIQRIQFLYGISPALRIDRKKDGRQFYYLYFPRELVRIIRPEIERYIIDNNIDTMFYKVGGKGFVESKRFRLCVGEVQKIRKLHASGKYSLSELASHLDFTYDQVQGVTSYSTYKDII